MRPWKVWMPVHFLELLHTENVLCDIGLGVIRRKCGQTLGLGLGWCQGTWVPHGVHMVHACMMEIKEVWCQSTWTWHGGLEVDAWWISNGHEDSAH